MQPFCIVRHINLNRDNEIGTWMNGSKKVQKIKLSQWDNILYPTSDDREILHYSTNECIGRNAHPHHQTSFYLIEIIYCKPKSRSCCHKYHKRQNWMIPSITKPVFISIRLKPWKQLPIPYTLYTSFSVKNIYKINIENKNSLYRGIFNFIFYI